MKYECVNEKIQSLPVRPTAVRGISFLFSIVSEHRRRGWFSGNTFKANLEVHQHLAVSVLVKSGVIENTIAFDTWINSELYGFTETKQKDIPDYRKIYGRLQASDSLYDWVPVVFTNSEMEALLCERKLDCPIGEILTLYDSPDGFFELKYNANISREIDKICETIGPLEYKLTVNNFHLKNIIDQVTTRLLEWTLVLESQGILGNDIQFTPMEQSLAQNVPQQINYYGTVINGDVQQSQVISGDHNTISFNYDQVSDLLENVKDALKSESLSAEDRETVEELIKDAETKIASKKKPWIVKAALTGTKDFLISTGANVASALLVEYLQTIL